MNKIILALVVCLSFATAAFAGPPPPEDKDDINDYVEWCLSLGGWMSDKCHFPSVPD